MLKIIICSTLVLLFFSNCGQQEAANLDVKIELKDKFNKQYADITRLKVLQNGKVFKIYTADTLPFIPHKIKLEKLKFAKYDFQYLNNINQPITKSILIKAPGNYKLSIYPDSTNYRKNIQRTSIYTLKDSETLSLFYKSSGCFHSRTDSLLIKKIAGRYLLVKAGRNIPLAKADIESLIKLESDLIEIPKDIDCTTVDTYRFTTKDYTKTYIDNTCNLNAWEAIKSRFEIKKL